MLDNYSYPNKGEQGCACTMGPRKRRPYPSFELEMLRWRARAPHGDPEVEELEPPYELLP